MNVQSKLITEWCLQPLHNRKRTLLIQYLVMHQSKAQGERKVFVSNLISHKSFVTEIKVKSFLEEIKPYGKTSDKRTFMFRHREMFIIDLY